MTAAMLTLVVWWGGLALQLALASLMLYRGLYRELPTFFAYVTFLTLRSVVLLPLDRASLAYFWTYWLGELVSLALGLAVIQEAMRKLFAPYAAVQRLVNLVFGWGAGLLLALGVLTAYLAPGSEPARALAGILLVERAVRIVQVGLLSLVFLLAGFLRQRWPHFVFGIAAGFGVYCAVQLAAITIRTHDAWTHDLFLYLKPAAFLLALVLWLAYLALPERLPRSAATPAPAPALEGWNVALTELLRR